MRLCNNYGQQPGSSQTTATYDGRDVDDLWDCIDCDVLFSSEHDWKHHMTTDAAHGAPFFCCDQYFQEIDGLCHHQQNAPSHEIVFECRTCKVCPRGMQAYSRCAKEGHELRFPCQVSGCRQTSSTIQVSKQHQGEHAVLESRLRRKESAARSRMILDGHNCTPELLYRVQYTGSATTFTDFDESADFWEDCGAYARSRQDPRTSQGSFRYALQQHCNWAEVHSPFISLFSNRHHAMHWAAERCMDWASLCGSPNTVHDITVFEVSGAALRNAGVCMWHVPLAARTMGIKFRLNNLHNNEWVCLHEIPHGTDMRSSDCFDDINEWGSYHPTLPATSSTEDIPTGLFDYLSD